MKTLRSLVALPFKLAASLAGGLLIAFLAVCLVIAAAWDTIGGNE